MAFESLPTIVQDDPIDVDYLNLIKGDLDDHETRITQMVGTIVANGSFESVAAASPYYPNNWARTHYTGGSSGTQVSDQAEGARCLYITSPGGTGNGGGYYDSDYVFCSTLRPVNIDFFHWSSVAGIHNQVILRWYDKDKTYLSEITLYDDTTTNPTSKTRFIKGAVPPAAAKFFKVRLIGAKDDDTTAGTAYFDSVVLVGGVDTVSGYASGGGVQGDRIYIDGTLSSPAVGADGSQAYGIMGAKRNVTGGGNVSAYYANAGGTARITVTLALPPGKWTMFAVASWGTAPGPNEMSHITAIAIREG